MKNQVLSIERMLHLKELGVDTSKASMCWVKYYGELATLKMPHEVRDGLYVLRLKEIHSPFVEDVMLAFTLQDIIASLPEYIPVDDEYAYDEEAELIINKNSCRYVYLNCESGMSYTGSNERSNNILESAYNLLCWCVESGYLKQ